ncbi:hypothetical protein D3C71_2146150 [compost metagenome]
MQMGFDVIHGVAHQLRHNIVSMEGGALVNSVDEHHKLAYGSVDAHIRPVGS